MKTKLLVTLLGGMLSTSFAMAMTSTPDYTLVVSDNLIGQYNIWDSGVYDSSSDDWWYQGTTYSTTSTVLGTHQNSDGLWYQTTQFVNYQNQAYTVQGFTQTSRSISLYSSAQVSDSFIDLSVSTAGLPNYSVYAYGTNGTTTTPRGFTTPVSPSLGLMVDGVEVASNTYSSIDSGYEQNYWQGSKEGSAGNTFEAVVEATNGSYINNLSVTLSSDKVLGAVHSETYSYELSRYTQDVQIAAVPEPETYAMLLAGLGLVGAIARRRKQNQG